MMKKVTFLKTASLALMLLVGSLSHAQERTCGMVDYMEEKMQDPSFAREYLKLQGQFKTEYFNSINTDGTYLRNGGPILIPVAVHFPTGNEADRACLEALAQTQVDILNADFTASNADITNWPAASTFYPGTNIGAGNVFFCLATMNHPAGTDPDLVDGGPAVTIGYPFGDGDQDPNFSGYMNFVVRPLGGGILGYSPLGGSVAAGQAVVLNTFAFGSGAGCPGFTPDGTFGLGRTVTHELGHFYNLDHPWGGNGGCGQDDGIADTPLIADPTFGCPENGSVDACLTGEYSLTMNYMDYVNDACMFMFTADQINVVDAYVSGVLASQFNSNVASCYTGPQFNLAATNSPFSTCNGEDVEFNISYLTTQGFNENTTFTASGEPAGTSVSFNPASINTNGTVIMNVTGVGSLALGSYDILVTATSAAVTKQTSVTINVTDGACASVANTDYETSVTGVEFNTISNLNTGKPSGYSDYTGISTDLNRGSSYDLTVYVNTDGNFQTGTVVWIDWNQDCVFDDTGEEYNLGVAQNVANGQPDGSPLSIVVPSDAVIGNTVMRVSTQYAAFPTACANGHDAEVEDYTINVLGSLSVDEFSIDSFVVYPNPNNGTFNIKLTTPVDNIQISVFDISGRNVYSNMDSNTNLNYTIDLGTAQSGIYLLQVSDGKRTKTKKIIVK